ncbi:sensor domain-containing diguanylate cyclase [Nitrosomonas supralitoralis]|uniref:diguanylate cyclase n=1 Tax=Nitrosomonas supralitoralis TaxID=2116706 RepID=A0A2P7NYJ5_9PROT|nr:diguanylate cyclase [Nitrosomonas supralitoralis]PSJ18555.1 diguanylate cyclase [Nitrosomonas supralitoralis]
MKKNDQIRALLRATEAMSQGNFAFDIPTGDDEIGQLGKSLEKLSNYLQKQLERNQSLYRIMVECNHNLHLIDVLNHIYESFQDHLPYDRISLALLENEGSKLKLHWSRAKYDPLILNTGLTIPTTDSSLLAIINPGDMLIIDDLNVHLQKYSRSRLTQAIFSEGIRSCLICPLLADSKPIGFIFFSSRMKNVYQGLHLHQDLALQIASQLSVLIEKNQLYRGVKLNKQLKAQKKSLEQRVTHDALTGLLNRPAIFDILHRQIQRAKRGGYGISIIMIDIDHFKIINDTYGHLAGDAVLCEIANRLSQSARSHEYIGRYGGEEFLAIISPYNQDGALRVAERFRNAVAGKEIHTKETFVSVTISLGVAIGTEAETLDEQLLLKKADEALYQAKHKGRNRVELANLQ